MFRILWLGLAAAVLLASGLIHGKLTDRWSNARGEAIQAGLERLELVSREIGPWESRDFDVAEVSKLEVNDKLVMRQYTNRLNGQTVGLLLTAGQPRNVYLWHTPLDCYPASGYDLTQPVTRTDKGLHTVPGAQFFVADFALARGTGAVNTRVFWSWSGDGAWQAPDSPKFAFGKYACLYKIYAIRQLLKPGEPLDGDPCLDFLNAALPAIGQTLFPPA